MNRLKLTTPMFSRAFGAAAIALFCLSLARPVAAQTVTSSDIQRLQDQVFDASNEVSRMTANQDDVAQLRSQLDDLRDEVVYLRVKLRKEGSVSQGELTDLQNRIQNVRLRARGEKVGTSGGSQRNDDPNSASVRGGVNSGVSDDRARTDQSTGNRTSDSGAIPVGKEIDVRLQGELSSATAQPEQRFEATTVADLYRGDQVLIPAGSTMRGIVSSVNKATRTDRRGSLTVAFDQVTIRGRSFPMRGLVTEALESEGIRGEVPKIGAGAGIGAIIGGIIGGARGALLGVLIGAGGTIAATEGQDVTLPAGTLLRVRMDQPPEIR